MNLNIFFCFSIFLFGSQLFSQTLLEGNYSSSDLGMTYTVITKQEGNVITVTEPNRVNQYKSNGGNTYYHSEPKYSHFYIRVVANNKYYAGKNGGSEQLFSYSGSNTDENEVLPSGIDDCPVYEKYLQLSQTDHNDAQAWVFCGAAALAKCTYSDPKPYLNPLIQGLKVIVSDANVTECPCKDAITVQEWNSVSID